MARIGFLLALLLLGGFKTCSAQAAPEQNQTSASLDELLAVGWKFGPDNMAQAITIYRDLKAAGTNDLNLQHAMVLVAIRQKQYPEAKQLLRSTIEKYPQTLNLRQTELWLLAITKDYEAALQTVNQLSADFKAPERARALAPLAGFCGQLIGCWQGPLKNQLPKTLTTARLTELEATILKQWPPELAQAFVTQRQATIEKYLQAKTQLEANRRDVAAQQEIDRANNQETNKLEHADVQKQLADLKAKADNIKTDFEKVRDELTIQLQTSQNQYNSLQAQYNEAKAQALNLTAKAKNYRAKDRDSKFSYDKEARDADRQAAGFEADCRQFSQQAILVKAQAARLANELSKHTAAFESEYKKMDQEYRKLELAEKKLVTQSKGLEKPATGLNSATRKELDKLNNLDSYVPYSLEEMKAALLQQK